MDQQFEITALREAAQQLLAENKLLTADNRRLTEELATAEIRLQVARGERA